MRRAAPALAAAAAAAALLALPSPVAAGSFRISQCAAVDGGSSAPAGVEAGAWSVSNGWHEVECGGAGGVVRLGTPNWRLAEGAEAALRFALPGSMPRTTARFAWLDWRFSPQSWSTNPAYLTITSSGARLLSASSGESGRMSGLLPTGSRGLELRVWCSPVNGPGWCNWPGPLLGVHGFTLELEEAEEPAVAASGPLTSPGRHEGVEPLALSAGDGDSGVRSVAVSLGGSPVGTLEPAGGCRADRLPPCPQGLRGTVDVDTRLVADGARRLRLVVTDAAGNARIVDVATVEVANQPRVDTPPAPGAPPAPPAAAAPPAPPSAASPVTPGRQYPPNPLAGRGHVPNGRNASERAWLAAWLEPRRTPSGALVRRASTTVPYGVRVRIRGRLTDDRGRPIARAALATIRREPGRPWRAVTGVRTRPDGRFTAFTRVGPSQELRFVYYAYGDSPRGQRSRRLRVRVRPR